MSRLRVARDPQGSPDVLRQSGRYVVPRCHTVHHARWKVRIYYQLNFTLIQRPYYLKSKDQFRKQNLG